VSKIDIRSIICLLDPETIAPSNALCAGLGGAIAPLWSPDFRQAPAPPPFRRAAVLRAVVGTDSEPAWHCLADRRSPCETAVLARFPCPSEWLDRRPPARPIPQYRCRL